jgi:hypothetical protein
VKSQPLSAEQRALLGFLLDRDFSGQRELAAQAESVETGGSSCSCGCPSFSLIADRSLPPAKVEQRMVSDAHGADPGGNSVGVLLFVEDGYLSEVEIFNNGEFDGFDGLPQPRSLTLSEWSSPDENGVRSLTNP